MTEFACDRIFTPELPNAYQEMITATEPCKEGWVITKKSMPPPFFFYLIIVKIAYMELNYF